MPQTEPAIANYDDHTAEEIKQRLRKLSQAELTKLQAHEKQGNARSTVLEAIAALRTDAPWSGYDEMEVEEVNDALKQRDGKAAGRVLDYERHHKGRVTVMEFAKRRRDDSDGSSSKSEAQPRRSPDESSSAASSRPASSSARKPKSSEGGSRPRPQSDNASRPRTPARKPSTTRSSQSGGPAIANYDDHTAGELTQRLRKLSQSDLAELEAYEKQGQGRTTVLDTIAALRGDEPWSGYDDMEVEEVNDALKQRDGETAGRVLDYERHHKERKTIIEFAKTSRQASKGSSASAPAPRSGVKRESRARTRSQSSQSSSRPQRAASKRSSVTSRRESASESAPRSTRGRSAKAAPRSTRAKTTSRPSATRASESKRASGSKQKQSKSSEGASRPRLQRMSASQPRTQAPEPSTVRASQSESRAKEAFQAVATRLKERATDALRSAEGPTKKMAKETGHAVGSAAQAAPAKIKDRATEALQNTEDSIEKRSKGTEQKGTEQKVGSVALGDDRDAGGSAVRGTTTQTLAAAANKAKTPALVGAAALATVGGGIALGSKVKLRRGKRVLGVPVSRKTAVGKAAKRVGKAVDNVSSTGHQIGQWSDDLQYLRQRLAGSDGPAYKLTNDGSAVSNVLEGKSGARRKITPRTVARRILC